MFSGNSSDISLGAQTELLANGKPQRQRGGKTKEERPRKEKGKKVSAKEKPQPSLTEQDIQAGQEAKVLNEMMSDLFEASDLIKKTAGKFVNQDARELAQGLSDYTKMLAEKIREAGR